MPVEKQGICITVDIDPDDDVERSVDITLRLFKELGVKATFFAAANHVNKKIVDKILADGHELGCHGLNHDDKEEFDKLSYNEQLSLIDIATKRLNGLAGSNALVGFRGPRVKINKDTVKVLEQLNYKYDSSVCSQRMDIFSSNLINLGWILAPRRPYRMDRINPFKKGSSDITEFPVSAFILPFISTTMRFFGCFFMKLFFDLIYWESGLFIREKRGNIVYLMHTKDFTCKKIPFSWSMLKPSRKWLTHGVPLRFWLIGGSSSLNYRDNKELIRHMQARTKNKDCFMTLSQLLHSK
jgi:hypothetical protein